MTPLRGWSPRGQRLRAFVPFGHWKTLTFIAALRCNRIEALCVFDGPINGHMFKRYVSDSASFFRRQETAAVAFVDACLTRTDSHKSPTERAESMAIDHLESRYDACVSHRHHA